MIAAFLGLLVAAQSSPALPALRVEELPDGQFRVIVTMRGPSNDPTRLAEQMIQAEGAIRTEAARRCQNSGGPVPVDRGQMNILQDRRWESISTFTCRTAAASPSPGG